MLLKQQNTSLILGISMALMLSSLTTSANAASCKLPKSYYKHVSCTASSSYFLAVDDSGKPVALLNKAGKQAVNLLRYQRVSANQLSEGLLPVQRGNKVGYLNMEGVEVVPASYDVLSGSNWARKVSNGLIVVKKNNQYGVINRKNTVLVPFSSQISSISDYSNGKAKMVRNGTEYWLDSSGRKKEIVHSVAVSSGSRATSSQSTASDTITSPTIASKSMASSSTTMPTPVQAGDMALQPQSSDGKWGFVDEHGTTMITYSFDEVMPYAEDLAGVKMDKKWGFIDKGGNLIVPFRFDESGIIKEGENSRYKGKPAFTFTEGKAWVGNLVNGEKMCIDKTGTNVSCD